MAGIGADAAVDAGLESEGAECTDFLHEAAHGAGHPRLGSSVLGGREIGRERARGGAHDAAPLRASTAPLMAREGKM